MSEVELPLNPPASATAADEPGLSSGLASILVIDDEAAIRESLEVLLSLEGTPQESPATASKAANPGPGKLRSGAARPGPARPKRP